MLAFSSHPFVTAHQAPPGGHPETTAAGDHPRVMGGEQRTAPGVGGGRRFLGNGLCGWARAGASCNVVGPCLEGHVVGDRLRWTATTWFPAVLAPARQEPGGVSERAGMRQATG